MSTMDTTTASLATPAATHSVKSPPVLTDDERKLSELKVILDNTAHLLVASQQLTVTEAPLTRGAWFEIFLAALDKPSQSPREVTVKRIRYRDPSSWRALPTAKLIQVWKDLKHPNVLGLLGYTLNHENEIDQLISPQLISNNIRDFLSQAPMEVARRIELVRDVTAGLDYLHGQVPPIYHGHLDPHTIVIDNNFNAVLTTFGPPELVGVPQEEYTSPETLLEEAPGRDGANDVWSWGCIAFEILTGNQPFSQLPSIFRAMVNREAPGQLDMLLELVPGVSKAEYASTLRSLHDILVLCWDYDPWKRPPISLPRQRAFMFSFGDNVGDTVVATLEELAHLLIPPDRLHIYEHVDLGAGTYGEVVLGTLDAELSTAQDVAVKRLKAVGTRGDRVRLVTRLARELNIWAKIKHPNVLTLVGYYLDEKYESPLLISAFMINGNVLNYIERNRPDVKRRIELVKGITAGLECLHAYRDTAICHADLKPANVLIDLQLNAVLCDFGLASFVRASDTSARLVTSTTTKGTPRYMSPELLLNSDCTHTLESDAWAWACTVFQVLTDRIPYAEFTGDVQFYLAIDRRELPGHVAVLIPIDPEDVDSESAPTLRFLYSKLSQCWDFNPRTRPSICALHSHLSGSSPQTGVEANGNKDVTVDDTQAQQILSDPSSRQETSFNNNENPASGGLEEGTKFAETSEDPSENCAEIKSAQEDKQDIPVVAHPEGEVAKETNPMVGQVGSGSAMEGGVDSTPQFEEGDQKAPSIVTSDRSSFKIPAQTLSIIILAAACILSLSANMFLILVLRKVDPSPPRHQEATRATYQERDL